MVVFDFKCNLRLFQGILGDLKEYIKYTNTLFIYKTVTFELHSYVIPLRHHIDPRDERLAIT